MKRIVALITALAAMMVIAGCLPQQSNFVNMSRKEIEQAVVDGKTTKADALRIFGEPDKKSYGSAMDSNQLVAAFPGSNLHGKLPRGARSANKDMLGVGTMGGGETWIYLDRSSHNYKMLEFRNSYGVNSEFMAKRSLKLSFNDKGILIRHEYNASRDRN